MADSEKKETASKGETKKVAKKVTKKPVVPEEKKTVKKAESKAKAKPKTSAKVKAKTKESTVSVTLRRSAIGRPKDQKATLVGLGFKRLNQTVVLKDTPQTRGMIKKVSHLVTVD